MAASRLRTRMRHVALGALLLALALAPGLAMAQAKGVPDAPPVERILARHNGFDLPAGFETKDGRQLPEGTYDLLLIESADRYYIQLTNTRTHKGLRVSAESNGEFLSEITGASETSVAIQSEKGRETFRFNVGEFTVATQLRKGS